MANSSSNFWQPRVIRRYIESRQSSTQVILVNTNLGDGYLKAIGNPEGEHALACEWVGSQLARWFGLPTFDFGIIEVTAVDRLPFWRRGHAKPGPAFIAKADAGEPWGGKARELRLLVNPHDISRLVVFDTWVLNEDRFFTRPDGTSRRNSNNVFLSEEAPTGKLLLRAMDHSHCFTNGREIIPKRLGVDRVQDTTVYGLFPEFGSFLDKSIVKKAVKDLRRMDRAIAESLIDTIPREWDVSANGRLALADFICRRAAYLAEKVSRAARWEPRIMTLLWPQGELFP